MNSHDDQFLKGKTALVTGGTRGIGRAITESLLKAGAKVAICGTSEKSVKEALADLNAGDQLVGHPANVSVWNEVESLFRFVEEQFGGLDILINNAGVGLFKSVEELKPEEWRRVIDTNLTGVYYCSHLAIPLMKKRGSGYVIHISSLAGKNAFAGGSAYNASKFGLNGFSEAMMQDIRHDNIRVSYVMPGSVDTEFSPRGSSGQSTWKIAPSDIAETVVWLLRTPERTLISRVEVRPSRPPK